MTIHGSLINPSNEVRMCLELAMKYQKFLVLIPQMIILRNHLQLESFDLLSRNYNPLATFYFGHII